MLEDGLTLLGGERKVWTRAKLRHLLKVCNELRLRNLTSSRSWADLHKQVLSRQFALQAVLVERLQDCFRHACHNEALATLHRQGRCCLGRLLKLGFEALNHVIHLLKQHPRDKSLLVLAGSSLGSGKVHLHAVQTGHKLRQRSRVHPGFPVSLPLEQELPRLFQLRLRLLLCLAKLLHNLLGCILRGLLSTLSSKGRRR
mmetsp:Transcript_66383/g.194311  ORF Transcript_66383/g.194311 Transcript_66383/m.194311 type:complete len:200 (-) Transcript_66383:208-807(-)